MTTEAGVGDLEPVQRPEPLRLQVQDGLIELIIRRVLPPGQHLVESEIAKRLQVSRQPVREALQALETDGWVELKPGRGAFVHEPTDAEVDEVFAVRAMLEAESAALAARHAGDADVAELQDICARGRQALTVDTADAADRVVAENATLHRTVTRLAGNALLADMLASLDRRVRWYFTPLVRSRGHTSWDEHDELIDALARGDAERAGAVMRHHTEQTRRAYQRNLGGIGDTGGIRNADDIGNAGGAPGLGGTA